MPPRAHWTVGDFCDELERELARFVGVTEGADPETDVATCPGWRLADLLDHVGSTHRWCTEMVRRLTPERVRSADLDTVRPPSRTDYPE
jgi:hypothetical protein